jgi:signal transduction histidine kinase
LSTTNLASRRVVLTGLSLCGVVTVGLLLLWRASGYRQLPYHDSFSLGKADEWESYDGTWRVVDSAVRNDSDARGSKFMTGSSKWTDYLTEADLQLLGDKGDAGLIVRSTDEEQGVDSYSGYYVGLRAQDGFLIIGRADHGWSEYQDSRMPGGVRPFHWYHLKVVSFGCSLAASALDPSTGATTTVALKEDQDSCASQGRIGLRSLDTGGIWKNVRAAPASIHDLTSLVGGHDIPPSKLVPLSIKQTLEVRRGFLTSQEHPTSGQARLSPVEPLRNLLLEAPNQNSILSARGVVILTEPVLYIQDSTGGISIPNVQGPLLKVGDEIEATGTVEPHDFSASLANATVRLLWAGVPDPPLAVTISQAATGVFDARFVELEAYLDGIDEASDKNLILSLHNGDQRFRAILKGSFGEIARPSLAQHSLLRVRGICSTLSEYTSNRTPFVLLLRSMDDIERVAGPPWWSARNLIAIVVGVTFVVLLVYSFYIRAEHWRLRAVIEERQRLAHELHDTLAQSFAGIGFQLGAIRKRLPRNLHGLHSQLEVASQLVTQGHQEARRSISTLRPNCIESIELLPALTRSAAVMVSGGSVTVEASTKGKYRQIPLKLTDVLFRVGLEAIANAVRHARATRIGVTAEYTINALILTVEDNGIGFVLDEVSDSFGLRGMKKRLESVGGTIQISSEPDVGTRIEAVVPLPRSYRFGFPSFGRGTKQSQEQSPILTTPPRSQ